MNDDAIRCDACPVLCYIKPGRTGACDRYGNREGQLVRLDPQVVLDRALTQGDALVPSLDRSRDWDRDGLDRRRLRRVAEINGRLYQRGKE